MKRCSTSLIIAAAAKLLQSCPTLCNPIDSSPPGSPWDSPGKNTGVGCHCPGNVNQNYNEVINSHQSERLLSKNLRTISAGEDVEKREPSYTLVGMYADIATVENSMEAPWKTKHSTTIWPSNPTTGHIPWENHNSKGHVHPNAHCRTSHNIQDKQST